MKVRHFSLIYPFGWAARGSITAVYSQVDLFIHMKYICCYHSKRKRTLNNNSIGSYHWKHLNWQSTTPLVPYIPGRFPHTVGEPDIPSAMTVMGVPDRITCDDHLASTPDDALQQSVNSAAGATYPNCSSLDGVHF